MYLDTAVLLKLVVPEPESAYYGRMVDGEPVVWTSELAVPEVTSALLRKEREKSLTARGRRAAGEQIQAYIEGGSLRLVPMTGQLLASAARLLEECHPRVALRTLDAVHLASFRESRARVLVTNDSVMRSAAAKLDLSLAPLAS